MYEHHVPNFCSHKIQKIPVAALQHDQSIVEWLNEKCVHMTNAVHNIYEYVNLFYVYNTCVHARVCMRVYVGVSLVLVWVIVISVFSSFATISLV